MIWKGYQAGDGSSPVWIKGKAVAQRILKNAIIAKLLQNRHGSYSCTILILGAHILSEKVNHVNVTIMTAKCIPE